MEPSDTSVALASCPPVPGGGPVAGAHHGSGLNPNDAGLSPGDTRTGSGVTSKEEEEDSSNAVSSDCKSPGQRYVRFIV